MLNCLKSLHGRFRQFASVIQMFAREREEATPQEITCGGEGLPVLSILHWMAPRRAVQQSQTSIVIWKRRDCGISIGWGTTQF
jgi:hypothetical protein